MFQAPVPGITAMQRRISGIQGHSGAWQIAQINATAEASLLSTNWDTLSGTWAISYDGKHVFYPRYFGSRAYIARRTLSSSWQISTAGAEDQVGLVNDRADRYVGFMFSNDGLTVTTAGYDNENWPSYEWTLSTPWDLSSAGPRALSAYWQSNHGPLGENGKNYLTNNPYDPGQITGYEYPVANDLTTTPTQQAAKVLTNPGEHSQSWKWDGSIVYMQRVGGAGNQLQEWDIPTPWDWASLATGLPQRTRSWNGRTFGQFSWNGTKWYDVSGQTIYQYNVDPL